MKFCWTRAYLLSVRCPIDCVEEERSTRGRCAQAVAQAQRKRLFEYFDYTALERAVQAAERYLRSLAHTTHRGVFVSGLQRAWVQWNAWACA